MSNSPNKVLVTRTDRIGDVILSLPVAGAIKQAIPEANVTFLVAQATAPVVAMCPWVDAVIETGSDLGDKALLATLNEWSLDAAVCLYPRSQLAALLQRAKIPIRVGTARRFYSYRFNRRINISRRRGDLHERDCNLSLLRGLGIDDPEVLDPVCTPPQEALDRARILLRELGLEPKRQRIAVVHPGCGGSARNWSHASYHQLCRLLLQRGVEIVMTGSQSEQALVDAVAADLQGQVHTLVGRTDLPTLAALLKSAGVFIGPSTGPMHLAAAVGTPVVALFGPVRTTGPERWGPIGDQHRVFTPPIDPCRCPVDKCRLGDCMAMIEPETVSNAVIEVLDAKHSEFRAA
jgi:ADP-heptose:LPS heptosyltransferase